MATRLTSLFSPARSPASAPAHLLHRALPRFRRRRALALPTRMSSTSASPALPDAAAAAGGEKPAAAPYGSWRSPITADVVSGADRRLGGIALAGDGRLLWIEGRPEEKGRMVIVKEEDKPVDVIPQEFAARTLAQEYGGGAFAVDKSVVVFSNYKDQRLYKQAIGIGGPPVPLTPDYGAPDVSYADGVFDPHFGRYVTVVEDRRKSSLNPATTIAAINLTGDDVCEPKELISGNDFYAFPRIDQNKRRMAWIEWSHPNMPWDKSELWVGHFSERGDLAKRVCVAGGNPLLVESPTEPKWSPKGLHCMLKKYMPGKKVEDINHNYVECLLYTFHHLAHKTPNTTNSLCGYKIVTGQPSDRLGEDFSEHYKDFTERLTGTEETVRAVSKRLTQGMADFNKAISSAKTEEEKTKIKGDQQTSTRTMRSYNNILAMTQPLHSKSPSFIGDKKITLSWMEQPKKPEAMTAGGKRSQPATNGNGPASKKGRGGMQNQLVNRAFEGLSRGGRGSGRGRGRGGRGRGRGWGGYR